jgi:3-deoxy-D-manno-octulosonate 8-phosphate phosphatase (KDO 8-P phosphatase)
MSKLRARKIKLLLFDVDGVMTDGSIWLFPAPAGAHHATQNDRDRVADSGGYSVSGSTMIEAKGFNAHDGAAFSLARLGGLKTGIITKRISETVALRARDLKIEYVYQGAQDKLTAFAEILKKEGIEADEACYVGDDVIDLPVMRVCGLAVAVRNAREEVKDEADFITDHRGGDGAVRDVVEYVLKAQGKLDDCVNEYIASRTPDTAFGHAARRARKKN